MRRVGAASKSWVLSRLRVHVQRWMLRTSKGGIRLHETDLTSFDSGATVGFSHTDLQRHSVDEMLFDRSRAHRPAAGHSGSPTERN